MGLRNYIGKWKIGCNRLTVRRIRAQYTGGQTLAEYALILALISVVAITTLISLGGQVSTVFTTINRQLNDANNGGSSSSQARGH